jgi:steroid delta-isomerase-like uncharacterized protein
VTVITIALIGEIGAEFVRSERVPAAVTIDRIESTSTAEAALVARFYDEAWNSGRLWALPDFVTVDHAYHDPFAVGAAVGPDGIARVIADLRRAFPDLVLTLDDVVVTGDRVAVRFTICGTHQGTLHGADGTGRTVTATGFAVHRFADGLIAETWIGWDSLDLALQLGLAVLPISALGQDQGAPSDARSGHPN